jgi:DNA-binding response OmpR family regulator
LNNTSTEQVNKKRILVIDNDRSVGFLIEKILTYAGIESIDIIDSAEQALKTLGIQLNFYTHPKECPYEMIILDIILPEMNGFDLCKKIKISFPYTPVMLISGYDIREIQSKVLECGADDFMKKPFNKFELVTRVNLLLSKNQKLNYLETLIENSILNKKLLGSHQIPYIGDRIDTYLVLDSIGLGKSSIIYKVIDLHSHEVKAMKILTAHSKDFGDIVQRFNYEIETMSRIDHPNVIRFYDRGEFNKYSYLVMEYLDGVNLEELIISQGRISESLLINIACDLASAICEIHKQGIIHRDIKLKNAIYNPMTGEVKLCDFGIAQLPNLQHITQDGIIIGTPIYMAPESFQGSPATRQSDIYSYGVTIYHLTTNIPPYVSNNNSELYDKQFNYNPTPIEEIRVGFSKKWSELIIDKCLNPIPEKRPSSMETVLDDLQEMKKIIS